MRKTTQLTIGAATAAFFLTGTLTFAQARSTARTSSPRDAAYGHASGLHQRKNGAAINGDYDRPSRNSPHATESMRKASGAKNGGGPLYEEDKKSGSNPLFEGKTSQKSSGSNNGSGPSLYQRKHIAGVKYEDRAQDSHNRHSVMSIQKNGNIGSPLGISPAGAARASSHRAR